MGGFRLRRVCSTPWEGPLQSPKSVRLPSTPGCSRKPDTATGDAPLRRTATLAVGCRQAIKNTQSHGSFNAFLYICCTKTTYPRAPNIVDDGNHSAVSPDIVMSFHCVKSDGGSKMPPPCSVGRLSISEALVAADPHRIGPLRRAPNGSPSEPRENPARTGSWTCPKTDSRDICHSSESGACPIPKAPDTRRLPHAVNKKAPAECPPGPKLTCSLCAD
jgi:hypothetical protein